MSNAEAGTERLVAFMAAKTRLLRLAYRHLGSVADAEDVVQEAWLRFEGAGEVRDAPRLLSTIVTRLCLDRTKSAAARREIYVGPWLPEPVAGTGQEPSEDAALDISFAVMRALERLSPAERAAFFLHDLWELSYEEIAQTLARSPQTCRKLVSRARGALGEARQRYRPSREEVERLVTVFRASVEDGDPARLKALLAEDAELIGDGGGKVLAALNPILGADAVSRFLVGIAGKLPAGTETSAEPTTINDQPALLIRINGALDHTLAFDVDADRRIRTIYIVRNPDKLARLQA